MGPLDLDLEDYDRIVSAFYDAALDVGGWGRALELMQALFKANFVTLILRSARTRDNMGLMMVVGLEEGGQGVTYLPYGVDTTPFIDQPVNKVFTVDDLMTQAVWRRTSYYQHWCKPRDVFHVMGADILTQESGRLRFRITRPEQAPRFSALDRRRCEAILPHLRRALDIHDLIDRSETMGSLYSQAIGRLAIGTLVLDREGSVLELNLVARQLIEANDGIKMVGDRLRATYPSGNRKLQKLISDACAVRSGDVPAVAEALSIERASGEVSLGVVVEPVPSQDWAEGKGHPAVVVYIRDASSKSMASVSAAQRLFNLTPAETTLTMELANGLSLEEAAEAMNIKRNTARAHLRSIFSKTGVRRQTELVRIVLNSVVALTKST